MFGSIGGFEMLVLMGIGLLVFGPRRLPEIGRTLGKAMVEFRRAAMELRSSIEKEIDLEELKDTTRDVGRQVEDGVRRATEEAHHAIPQEIRDLREIKPIDLGTEPRTDDVAPKG
jgi:Tat protein translocase TatB subunit